MLCCVNVHAVVLLLSSCKYEILQGSKTCHKEYFDNVTAPELSCLKMCNFSSNFGPALQKGM